MIYTTFPLYEASDYPVKNKIYFSSQPYRILVPDSKLLPFQFATVTTFSSITHIYLYNAKTGALVRDLLSDIETTDFDASTFSSPEKTYIQYTAASPFKASYKIPVGNYTLSVVTNVSTFYSDEFTVVTDLFTKGRYMEIRFSNTKDLDDVEPICYQNSWSQRIYFDADIKGAGHQIIEEVDEKDGYELPRTKSVYEVKRVRLTVSESVYSALIRLPLHDTVTFYDRAQKSWSAFKIKIGDPVWSGGGAFCRVLIEFMTATATMNNTVLNMS